MMRNENDIFVTAVIVAAGKGTRMNMDINKQYVEVNDVPVLARTLKAFSDCYLINDIVLVVNGDDIPFCKKEIVDNWGIEKVKCIVSGGAQRQESVIKGLSEVDNECEVVVIHDGARPFVLEEEILDCIYAADEYGAACVAVPVKDTIKVVDDDCFIEGTPERSKLWAMQTPQGFRYDLIMKAHETAREQGFFGTDDAVLVERIGTKVKLVKGSYYNIKITTQEDLVLAKAIVEALEE